MLGISSKQTDLHIAPQVLSVFKEKDNIPPRRWSTLIYGHNVLHLLVHNVWTSPVTGHCLAGWRAAIECLLQRT